MKRMAPVIAAALMTALYGCSDGGPSRDAKREEAAAEQTAPSAPKLVPNARYDSVEELQVALALAGYHDCTFPKDGYAPYSEESFSCKGKDSFGIYADEYWLGEGLSAMKVFLEDPSLPGLLVGPNWIAYVDRPEILQKSLGGRVVKRPE